MVGKLKEYAQAAEKLAIEQEIEKQAGNLSRTAEALGIDRKTLYNKIIALKIKFVRKAETIK